MNMIRQPVIVIGCPRSGTTMLFTILSQSEQLWSMYRESWNVIRGAYDRGFLDPQAPDDRISAEELSPELREFLLDAFHAYSVNHPLLASLISNHLKLSTYPRSISVPNPLLPVFTTLNVIYKNLFVGDYRFLEKTPRNCFRVAFMDKLFPDAKFIFISRDPRTNISSLMEGWKSNAAEPHYKRFPVSPSDFKLSNFDYHKWEYVLPPDWQKLNTKTLEEVCAHQWISSNAYALDDLEKLDQTRVSYIRYEDLTSDTVGTISRIAKFIDIPYSGALKAYAEQPPLVSNRDRQKPSADKWRKNQEAIESLEAQLKPMQERLECLYSAEFSKCPV